MPFKPKKPCGHPRCPALVDTGYCDEHKRTTRATADDSRGTAAERGYGSAWQRARDAYLRENPLCRIYCPREGRTTAASVVDHIIPHRGDQKLFWDRNNWQPGCKTCHDRKTATEDGGFGRLPRTAAR